MIKEIKIKPAERSFWKVGLDGYTEECPTKKVAEETLERLQEKKIRRLKDFLIAEKIMGYVWIHYCGRNCLVKPTWPKTHYCPANELGKSPDFPVEGIFDCCMTDGAPPEYEGYENFGDLIAGLISRDLDVLFWSNNESAACQISDKVGREWFFTQLKEEKHWAVGYCQQLALKEAAYLYAKSLEKL